MLYIEKKNVSLYNEKDDRKRIIMGYIKEPEGVDFIINGRPLTEEEDRAISEFFKANKAKRNRQTPVVRKTKNRKVEYA
jgi:hypothetical protein